MASTDSSPSVYALGRQIGPIGTCARILLGLVLIVFGALDADIIVSKGHLRSHLDPWSLILGVVAFPLLMLGLQSLRARVRPARFEATGPVASALNILVFVALAATPLYAPQLSLLGYTALVFYGASMWVAALRGYDGCEVLAIPNWIHRRDDQVGCLVFGPLDHAERRSRLERPRGLS